MKDICPSESEIMGESQKFEKNINRVNIYSIFYI